MFALNGGGFVYVLAAGHLWDRDPAKDPGFVRCASRIVNRTIYTCVYRRYAVYVCFIGDALFAGCTTRAGPSDVTLLLFDTCVTADLLAMLLGRRCAIFYN